MRQRLQSLWQEYQEVARQEMGKTDGQLVVVSQKLSVFLDSFQSAYKDFKESGRGACPCPMGAGQSQQRRCRPRPSRANRRRLSRVQLSAEAGLSLESLFGDCSEMLIALLELVDKHAQSGLADAEAIVDNPAVLADNLASMAGSAEAQVRPDFPRQQRRSLLTLSLSC
mgnify:CR=1 FL=1|jgi:hypothetical protein